VPNPTANSTVSFGVAGSNRLAQDLGLTADGQYWAVITAVDTTMNESVATSPVPFVRNLVAPAAPTNLRTQ